MVYNVIFHGYFHDDFILISKIKGTWFKDFMNLTALISIIIQFYVPLKIIYPSIFCLSLVFLPLLSDLC